jgi:hypothetical protein
MGVLARAAAGDRERGLGRRAVIERERPGPDERMGTTDDIVVGGAQQTCPKE